MTAPVPLNCPKCQGTVTEPLSHPGAPKPCRACDRPLEGLVFAAYFRPPATGKSAEAVLAPEDAGCFYHPQSRAQVPCDVCGRFLCALCDVDLNGQHLCPACLSSGAKKKSGPSFDSSRLLYGQLALLLCFLPILCFSPATIITAPLAVFFAIYGWNKPQSLTSPSRVRYILALLLGLAQIAIWGILLLNLFNKT